MDPLPSDDVDEHQPVTNSNGKHAANDNNNKSNTNMLMQISINMNNGCREVDNNNEDKHDDNEQQRNSKVIKRLKRFYKQKLRH